MEMVVKSGDVGLPGSQRAQRM